ncbi:hypothetical protein LOH54_09875 [Sulfurimonas sp. HSL-3221]|uniref:hypothetical protein n=1 Tax=Sulfurimonadaceae TaxID=2771471 RepID=UPI001E4173A1|nr:hypothetical protein [Sulfurimonas sp. HSL-3221]UFS61956.1 hypothetical protein LOH54_09875 [Sulfurimonas sp. HSL-3221]
MKRLVILFYATTEFLRAALTPEQLSTLQTVRDVARSIPDRSGETYENTLSAICLTESSAGRNIIGDFHKGVDITKASLGPMQVQVATARYVAARVKTLAWLKARSDVQIANLLLTDLKLSAGIAAHYLVILKNRRHDYMKSVSGYNGGMVNWPYFGRVMKHMKLVKRLVASGALQ